MENTKDICACSYKEVMTILAYLEPQELEKIPKEKINYFFDNMDNSYEYELNYSESFQEQEMLPMTEAILANLFRDYLATPEQKERILLKEKNTSHKLEEEKGIGESSKTEVENNIKQEEGDEPLENKLSMIEYKESFITKIKKWFQKNINFGRKSRH